MDTFSLTAIFTTADNYYGICHDFSMEPWQSMFKKLGKVYIDKPIVIPEDPEDPLFIFDMADTIRTYTEEADYIKSISENPQKVLEKPCGIFLLNVSQSVADKIQDSYGVVCQSTSNLSHNVLTNKGTAVEVIENEADKNWSDIFRKIKKTPSNSAIIIDAYLFENDSFDEVNDCYDEKNSYGRDNLLTILENILPLNFDDVYHVAIFLTDTDEAKKENRSRTTLTNARIANVINKLISKKKIHRPYDVCIEVYFFSRHEGFHDLIHNRRILSNYYVLDAQYKLAAFDKNGKGRTGQTLSVHPIFELIHIDSESDTKERRLRNDLARINKYIELKRKSKSAVFYQNGRRINTYNVIKHRLMVNGKSKEE